MDFIVSYSIDGLILELPIINLIVYDMLRALPRGNVTSYGELAKALGDVIAARAVARILAKNPRPDIIPCYKVVASDGSLGGYTPGGPEVKAELLTTEGIPVRNLSVPQELILKAENLGLRPYLSSLKRIQSYLARKVSLSKPKDKPNIVAGVDIAYVEGTLFDIGIGVAVLYSLSDSAFLAASISVVPVLFPYIPTYLAFRELPIIAMCVEELRKHYHIEAVLIDGHGILHPRRFGIASHAGLVLGMPSIGVAKSLLIGREGEPIPEHPNVRPIYVNDEIRGYSLAKGRRKVFFSPGHLIDLKSVLNLLLELPWKSGITPQPLYAAHKLATRIRKKLAKILSKNSKLL